MDSKWQSRNSKFRNELLKRQTPQELKVAEWLLNNKIRFIPQKGFLLPFSRIVDFYLPKRKIIIEIDGGYHKDSAVAYKDYKKDSSFIAERKMKVIRITNEYVDNGMFAEILSSVLL